MNSSIAQAFFYQFEAMVYFCCAVYVYTHGYKDWGFVLCIVYIVHKLIALHFIQKSEAKK